MRVLVIGKIAMHVEAFFDGADFDSVHFDAAFRGCLGRGKLDALLVKFAGGIIGDAIGESQGCAGTFAVGRRNDVRNLQFGNFRMFEGAIADSMLFAPAEGRRWRRFVGVAFDADRLRDAVLFAPIIWLRGGIPSQFGKRFQLPAVGVAPIEQTAQSCQHDGRDAKAG